MHTGLAQHRVGRKLLSDQPRSGEKMQPKAQALGQEIPDDKALKGRKNHAYGPYS